MSMDEVKRFAADLNANWSLRSDAEKFEANSGRGKPPLARAVVFAAKKGYAFTLAEAAEFAKAQGTRLGLPVDDADLEAERFPHAGGVLGIITGDF